MSVQETAPLNNIDPLKLVGLWMMSSALWVRACPPLIPFASYLHLCVPPRLASNARVGIHLTFIYAMSTYNINVG
jgi:hypothetical protein